MLKVPTADSAAGAGCFNRSGAGQKPGLRGQPEARGEVELNQMNPVKPGSKWDFDAGAGLLQRAKV